MFFSKCLRGSETKALSVFDFKRLFEDALNKIPLKKSKIDCFLACILMTD